MPFESNVCVLPLPRLTLGTRRELFVYSAGAIFAIGWWLFFDGVFQSRRHLGIDDPDSGIHYVPVSVTFADWVPGLCSLIGMIIVNVIDKQKLLIDGEDDPWSSTSWGSSSTQWRARLYVFIGLSFLAGGLAGSVALLVAKYIVPHYAHNYGIEWGIASVFQTFCITLSSVITWFADTSEKDYEYSLTN